MALETQSPALKQMDAIKMKQHTIKQKINHSISPSQHPVTSSLMIVCILQNGAVVAVPVTSVDGIQMYFDTK